MGRNSHLTRQARQLTPERVLLVVVIATAALGYVALGAVVSPAARGTVQAAGNALAALGVAALALRTAGAHVDGRLRLSWSLLGVGLTISGLADGYVALAQAGGVRPGGLPVAELGHVLMVPFAFGGVLLRPRLEPRTVGRPALLIDTWLAMSALVAVAWVLVLAPIFEALGTDPVTQALVLANPLGHLGLVCCLLIALLREADTRRATGPLLLGLLVMVAGDAGRGALLLHGAYQPGHPIDVLRFAALGVIGVAAAEEWANLAPTSRAAGRRRIRTAWRFVAPAALLALTTVIVWLASVQRGAARVGVAEVALAAGWLLLLARVGLAFRHRAVDGGSERRQRGDHAAAFRRELQRRRRLETVQTLSADLSRELDLAALLPQIAQRAAELLDAPVGVVLLWDAESRLLEPAARHGLDSAFVADTVDPTVGAIDRAIEGRRGVLVNRSADIGEALPLLAGTGVAAAAVTPLYASERLVGVIVVAERQPDHPFGTPDLQILDIFGRQAAVAIDHARLVEEAASFEAVREVARAKTELLSTVSHELRTPLTLIHGYAELLNARAASLAPDEVGVMAGEILAGSRTMIRLVDDLLDFSRMTSSRLHLDRAIVDVGAAVGEEVAAWTAPEERARIAVEFGPDPLMAYAEPRRVGQIVRNLLSNALGHAPAGPVQVRVQGEPGWVRIEVADHGPGIPPAELPRVWESFYRGERARNSPRRGSGLGLAVVRQLVDLHGGRADVVSTEGAGAVFRVWLPTRVPGAAASPTPPPAAN